MAHTASTTLNHDKKLNFEESFYRTVGKKRFGDIQKLRENNISSAEFEEAALPTQTTIAKEGTQRLFRVDTTELEKKAVNQNI